MLMSCMQVRLKVEEPPEQLDEADAKQRLRKLKEKELSELKVLYARDQSGGIELAKRALSGKKGSWKPLLYGPSPLLKNGKGSKKDKSGSGGGGAGESCARLDWGVHGDGGLGCTPGLPAVGFDLWAAWIISGVTVSLASSGGGGGTKVQLALEAASCARAFGRDELCTRLGVFESDPAAAAAAEGNNGVVVRHTLARPVNHYPNSKRYLMLPTPPPPPPPPLLSTTLTHARARCHVCCMPLEFYMHEMRFSDTIRRVRVASSLMLLISALRCRCGQDFFGWWCWGWHKKAAAAAWGRRGRLWRPRSRR
jgi:hypothetical protein